MNIRIGAICAALVMSASAHASTIDMTVTKQPDTGGPATYLYSFSITNNEDHRIDEILIPFLGDTTIEAYKAISGPPNWAGSYEIQGRTVWDYDPVSDGAIGAGASLYENPKNVVRLTFLSALLDTANADLATASATFDRAESRVAAAQLSFNGAQANYERAVAYVDAIPEEIRKVRIAVSAAQDIVDATEAEITRKKRIERRIRENAEGRAGEGFSSDKEEEEFEARTAASIARIQAEIRTLRARKEVEERLVRSKRSRIGGIEASEDEREDAVRDQARYLDDAKSRLTAAQADLAAATGPRDEALASVNRLSAPALLPGKTLGQFQFTSSFGGALGPIQLGLVSSFAGALIPFDPNSTPLPVSAVPLPAAGWLLGAGLLGFGLIGRRNKTAA
jgi:hypothetical protein